ncbi:MAG TPA: ABC transporter ATP-binding protein [Thermoanaerobaculia bacterium]
MLAVKAEGLSKTYMDEAAPVTVFQNLDFDLEKGVFAAVMGPSGVGKSTLLHLLGGIDRPDAGRVEILGVSLDDLSPKERARFRNERIGFVFQFHHLLPEFTAEENVAFPHRIAGISARDARQRAAKLLDRVGLADRHSHLSRSLSGGEQQRVAIARALARGPSLLLADEPTGNLDSESARGVFDLLTELHRECAMTTVLVTHNPELAKRCDKIFNMSREGILPATRFSG